jgi:hypothetical protein
MRRLFAAQAVQNDQAKALQMTLAFHAALSRASSTAEVNNGPVNSLRWRKQGEGSTMTHLLLWR